MLTRFPRFTSVHMIVTPLLPHRRHALELVRQKQLLFLLRLRGVDARGPHVAPGRPRQVAAHGALELVRALRADGPQQLAEAVGRGRAGGRRVRGGCRARVDQAGYIELLSCCVLLQGLHCGHVHVAVRVGGLELRRTLGGGCE